jgi:hypothetical protein
VSTQAYSIYSNTPSRQGLTTNNQQYLLDITADESMDGLPDEVASSHVASRLETTLRKKANIKTQNKTLQGTNLIKENTDRLNRANFFLKNISTSMTYMDVFMSIVAKYPLVQLNTINTTENLSKIQYLCIAGNILINMNNIN